MVCVFVFLGIIVIGMVVGWPNCCGCWWIWCSWIVASFIHDAVGVGGAFVVVVVVTLVALRFKHCTRVAIIMLVDS